MSSPRILLTKHIAGAENIFHNRINLSMAYARYAEKPTSIFMDTVGYLIQRIKRCAFAEKKEI